MDIYNIKDAGHVTKGMQMDTFSEMLVSVSDNPKFKTIDKLAQYSIIFLNTGSVDIKETKYAFLGTTGEGQNKKQFFLQDKNTVFKLYFGDKSYYGTTCAGEVFLDHDKTTVETYLFDKIKAPLSGFNEVEKKAWAWLDGPDTGSSSMTVCYHLYPQLSQHYRLKDLIVHNRESHPHDNADFNRILGFLQQVPEARELLPTMAEVSPQWRKLIASWDEIEKAIKSKDNENAYKLIKAATNKETVSIAAPR